MFCHIRKYRKYKYEALQYEIKGEHITHAIRDLKEQHISCLSTDRRGKINSAISNGVSNDFWITKYPYNRCLDN